MNIIGVPNLKEIETQEGCFNVICNFVQRRKIRKMWRKLGTNILRNAKVIYFSFDM